ncbi:hypothetical protein [Ornithinimicrobium tianjinense]|uniref:DoxX protein n=1 Tax=Ornithinimicrobium tianjinense TaxID=1195761 RepID=A0A917F9Q0_9MICO|nr:hypothetical protein [Ornithinimicrobium tianjinense]GGF58209.1 hypothetical protein GCM10011366_27490 [Ornithinimicrobium tianjinense]
MSHTTTHPRVHASLSDAAGSSHAAHQAFLVLRTAFTVAPIVFGLDKFTNLLVDWTTYLAPPIAGLSPFSPQGTMYVVGVIEIVAGVLVALHPRLGGAVVALWLAGIILNLLLIPGFYDVALRDVGLLLAAVALQRLSTAYDRRPLSWPVRHAGA